MTITNLYAIAEDDVRRIVVFESIRENSIAFFGEVGQRYHVSVRRRFVGWRMKRMKTEKKSFSREKDDERRKIDTKRHTLRYK